MPLRDYHSENKKSIELIFHRQCRVYDEGERTISTFVAIGKVSLRSS